MGSLRLSPSAVKVALDCPAEYNYRYNLRLVSKPADVPVALRRGTWIHACLEALHKGVPDQLDQMSQWALDHGVPAESVEAMREEVTDIVTGYVNYWNRKQRHPLLPVQSEVTFDYTLPNGDVLIAILDTVVEMRGEYYILEHKSTMSFPDADWRTLDKQTALQYMLANLHGYPVVGIIFNYLKTARAPVPEVTKTLKEAPRFYARDITTTSIAFEKGVAVLTTAFAERYTGGDEAAAYASIEGYVEDQRAKMVRDDEFYLREIIYKPNVLLAEVLKDVKYAAAFIRLSEEQGHWPRNTRSPQRCSRCTYAKLCPVEAWRGGVASNLRETLFEVETPDLRSEGRTLE